MKLMHGFCLVDHAWVVVVHAVDVGPYLYLLSIQGSTYKRSRIVAAAPLQVVDFSVGITADESLGKVDLCTLVLLDDGLKLFLDVDGIGFGVLVGAHEVECVQQHGVDALFLHVVGNHVGRHHFTLRYDALLFKAGEEFLGERAQIVEFVLKEVACCLLGFLGGVEFFNMPVVLLFQAVDDLVGTVGVLLVEVIGNLNKRVGRSRHGRQYYKHWVSRLCDKLGHFFHSLGCSDGCAAKFHDFHICCSFNYYSSSLICILL